MQLDCRIISKKAEIFDVIINSENCNSPVEIPLSILAILILIFQYFDRF